MLEQSKESKSKSTYAKIHEPKTLFTRDSYFQYLEGQLNKMAIFMSQSIRDTECINQIESLIKTHDEKILKLEHTMKTVSI
jgi:hypothetical protein